MLTCPDHEFMKMASGHPKPRVFTGTVTKMHKNFGFIDDDVFFQLAVCDGKVPNIGDRVLVEAKYNPNMPFEWNASHVQFVGRQQQAGMVQIQAAQFNSNRSQFTPQGLKFVPGHGGVGLLGAAPINVMNQQQRIPQPRRQMGGKKRNAPRPAARDRPQSPRRRSRDKDQQKKRRTRTPPKKLSPMKGNRDRSVEKMPRRPAPRYMVQFARRDVTRKSSNVLNLKQSFSSLYIPSDFFSVEYNWQNSFTLQQPLSAGKCHFYVLHKDVEMLEDIEPGILNPPDVDHTWAAKVMLLQVPNKEEIYKQCCKFAEDNSDSFLHQSRVFKFLVGCKGKKEQMAIGGSWSPSLDGPDPANNPGTLVRTAIRTCKALTGIDLSKCTQWRRMLEIQYHRDAEVHKGHSFPARVETTVIFLPDVHSCMLSSIEYKSLCANYIDKCEAVIKAKQEAADKPADKPAPDKVEEKPDDQAADVADNDVPSDQKEAGNAVDDNVSNPENEVYTTLDESIDTEVVEKDSGKTPTHHSKLDVKSLKVQPLRKELEARGLSPRGLKSALIQRLTEAVEKEQRLENESKDVEMKEEVKKEEDFVKMEMGKEDSKNETIQEDTILKDEKIEDDSDKKEVKEEMKKEEKSDESKEEKVETEEPKKPKIDVGRIKRHYTLPESHPSIPVHPNSEFKKGNFDCLTTSLSSLLDYRQDDNKESIFEVSVFAEAFYEMLQRQHAFNIYTALSNPLPELEVEEEKDENKDEEMEQDKEEIKDEEEDEKEKFEEESDEPKAKKSKNEDSKSDEKEKEESDDPKKESSQEPKEEEEKKPDRKRSESQELSLIHI